MSRSFNRPPSGRTAYTNGRYLPHANAQVHIEDRGLQFADSVYEVVMVSGGRLIDEPRHLDRLERSLCELSIARPLARSGLKVVLREIVRRNRLVNGFVYLQVTRGAYARDHAAPSNAKPNLIVTARHQDPAAINKRRETGVTVVTTPEIRWGRCDIKSTALLPNVLAKTAARSRGAFEAWFVDEDGFVTEGASSNAWIVSTEGRVVTRALSNQILPGVTRAGIIAALKDQAMAFEERSFRLEEALRAREAFVTSATAGVMPVVGIDGASIGNGHPGSVAQALQAFYAKAWGLPV